MAIELKTILELDDIKAIKPNLDALRIISRATAEKIEAIPFDINKKEIYVLTTNNYPNLLKILEDKLISKWYKVKYFYTEEKSFFYAFKWYDYLKQLEEKSRKEEEEFKKARWQKAIQLIKKLYEEKQKYTEWQFIIDLIRLSYQAGASDLHFQPEEIGVVMRLRKDWILKTILTFSHSEFKKYLLKLKYLSWVRMNVDWLPQDWRFDFEVEDINGDKKKIDVRVSFMPGLRWESVVMRFLDSSKGIMSFTQIWFLDDSLDILQKNLKKTYWMILVTWPTGSWKTTTLYSMLSWLNDPWKKIITLEDPVEYELPGIQQSQINEKKWYTYEEWLKAILRQDPDIIMVWEIRTKETAEIAINAALTWHLVLSTLHTNSAIEAISRLLNMGIKPYLLGPSLNLIIWQRLVRKLHSCYSLKEANYSEKQEIEDFIKKYNDTHSKKLNFDWKIPIPTWCEECGYEGYQWRIAIVETLDINDDIKNMISQQKSISEIYWVARQYGFITMKEDGYIKVLKRLTTLDEVRRVI